jgi:hypothetical protein
VAVFKSQPAGLALFLRPFVSSITHFDDNYTNLTSEKVQK